MIVENELFVGLGEQFFIIRTQNTQIPRNARKTLGRILDLDVSSLMPLDRYGMELIGLSPWPLAPQEFLTRVFGSADEADVARIRSAVAKKMPGYGVPEGSIAIYPPSLGHADPMRAIPLRLELARQDGPGLSSAVDSGQT